MKQLMGIQVKMYPNQQQQTELSQLFGNDRYLWNHLLEMMIKRHKNNHRLKILTNYDMQQLLKCYKQEVTFLKNSDSSSLQIVCDQLYHTWQMFFKNPHQFGKPNFHSKHKVRPSYTGKSMLKVLANHYVKIPKMGIMKVNGLNQLLKTDKIKRYTLMLRPNGGYYLSLMVERDKQALPKTNKSVGIDLGLHDLAITSDGTKYQKLDFHQLDNAVKFWQRKMDKRKHWSKIDIAQHNHNDKTHKWDLDNFNGWQKARLIKASRQGKIANIRKDIMQKITTELVKAYDVIVIEDLHVKNMLKNHHLANAISNHAWYQFRLMLQYKCAWYGKTLIVIPPQNTSRICHCCGAKNHDFDGLSTNEWLAIREWTCPTCQQHHDRDVNASINILNQGLATL